MKAARVVEYPPAFTRNHRISGVITRRFTMKARGTLLLAGLSLMLGACSATAVYPAEGVKPEFSFPVTTNETPYSVCLAALSRIPGNNLPVFSVGDAAR